MSYLELLWIVDMKSKRWESDEDGGNKRCCRIFVSKNLKTQPIGREIVIFDNKKLWFFRQQSTQIGAIRSSLKNVSIGDVEGQGPAATGRLESGYTYRCRLGVERRMGNDRNLQRKIWNNFLEQNFSMTTPSPLSLRSGSMFVKIWIQSNFHSDVWLTLHRNSVWIRKTK